MNRFGHSLSKLIVLAGICLGVALSWTGCHRGNSQENERNNIAEAVFRYQFDHCNLDSPQQQVFFLALGFNTDPDEVFMKRFIGSEHTVKRFSQSDYKEGLVTDKDTGRRGTRISVTEIKKVNDKEAEVKGACFSIFGTIRDQVYLVVKENDKWVVKNAKNILDV